jgi:hypothetical protein
VLLPTAPIVIAAGGTNRVGLDLDALLPNLRRWLSTTRPKMRAV